jgi:glycosyltransferase involved in cell wall biosynthesis
MILDALQYLRREGWPDEFVPFYLEDSPPLLSSADVSAWRWQRLPPGQRQSRPVRALKQVGRLPGVGKLVASGQDKWRQLQRRYRAPDPDRPARRPAVTAYLHGLGIELMLYPQPMRQAFEVGLPYIMAVHDLQHRLQPEFPEVSADGEWEAREYLFRNGARYATLLLADSEVGKEDILRFYGPYGLTADRVKVLPFVPAPYLSGRASPDEVRRVREAYGLSEAFLFYPAQFWAHKNHARIIEALALLRDEHGLAVQVAFAGGNRGRFTSRNFRDVMRLARKRRVVGQVKILGYVPEGDMAPLYTGARALIMPTFFGPTNIPLLEAWACGCPVITSDIRGVAQQMGDAAVLVDPRSTEAIAAGIVRVWTDEPLRQALVSRGQERLASYSPTDFRQRLRSILEEARERVRSGDVPPMPYA